MEKHLVHNLHHVADLCFIVSVVLHYFRIVAGVDRDPIDVFCVSEGRAPQQELLNVYSDRVWHLCRGYGSLPTLKVLVGLIADNLAIKSPSVLIAQALDGRYCLLLLHGRLSIEVQGVNKCDTVLARCLEQKHVCRELCVLLYLDKRAELDIVPLFLHPLAPLVVIDLALPKVDLVILLPTEPVL